MSVRNMRVKLSWTLKVLWIFACLAVFGVTLVRYDGPSSDVYDFLFYCMILLSFPSGLLWLGLGTGVEVVLRELFAISITFTLPMILLVWLGFFAFGAMQWFYVLPRFYRRVWDASRRKQQVL